MPPFRTWLMSEDGRQGTCRITQGLRCLPEDAQKRTPHPLSIAKASGVGDLLDRQAALFKQETRSLEPKAFDRPGRRNTGLGTKDSAELARAEARGLSELFD